MLEITDRKATEQVPLADVPFVLLDVETTGLDAHNGDRLVEIALIRRENGETVRRWETLINPGRAISVAAYAVNQIDAASLVEAPTFAEIADRLLQELAGTVIVAHNVPFDVEFLNVELARLGRPPLPNIMLDTLTLARQFLLHDRYSLSALSHDLGFDRPAHRAMSDVIALSSLLDHLLARLRMLGVTTLGDLLRAHRGLLPGQPEPEAPPLLAEALRNGSRLRIAYRTRGAEPIDREILPLELQMAGELPRLMAFCYLRNGPRTFYLDRIDTYALVDASGATIQVSTIASEPAASPAQHDRLG
jgi:DNA polymerase III subunit epsilon